MRDSSLSHLGSPSTKLTLAERSIISTQSIYIAAALVANVFLSLYLFQNAGLGIIAQFQIGIYGTQCTVMAFGGILLRQYNTRRLTLIACVCMCILYFAILLLGKRVADYPWSLGVMQGAISALFWMSINVNEFVATH